ncbi:hypothetical protein [Desulfosediminicola sp.]|uniref:hypothetical protein n=1 Tax=Desulfosediminicola sp. TaxID=2886825 RepID=UPI003AF21FFE
MPKKLTHRRNIIEYLANPKNAWLSRTEIATLICGYKEAPPLYRLFTKKELGEIEDEALAQRKQRCCGQRAMVYQALYEKAVTGNVQAAKEWLDRVEGKVVNKVESSHQLQIESIQVEVVRARIPQG